MRTERSTLPTFFLPDFCAGRMTLATVLIAELVAIVITIVRQALHDDFWSDLASSSLFLLWLGLGCAAALCRARFRLSQMTTTKASLFALLLIVTVVALISEATYQIGQLLSGGHPLGLGMFPPKHAVFVLHNVCIGVIVGALALRYFFINSEWKRTIELEAQARLRALQARIRPHFLFNSMNTIASLTRTDPPRAEQAVEDLADLFRANLSDAKERIPLQEELAVAKVYERIEQLRLGERLQVEWDIESLPKDAMVPSLLVQPLLENAVYHGIERLAGGGVITIVGKLHGDMILLAVANPIVQSVSQTESQGQREGNKLALNNIKQRLELAWPGRSKVLVEASADRYSVTLTFPYGKRRR